MSLIQPKQIKKLIAAGIAVAGFAMPAAATADVTAAITTSLATAGANGSVPLQVASTTVGGVVTTGQNMVEVLDSTTKTPLVFEDGATDREVYGRITEAAGTYTLELYYLDGAGAETAFTAAAGNIDFDFSYRFEFNDLPSDAITSRRKNIIDDPLGAGANVVEELVAVTATDTLDSLSQNYVGTGLLRLYVNGKLERSVGANPSFTVTGNAVTWSAANAGYSLVTGDEVVAEYAV